MTFLLLPWRPVQLWLWLDAADPPTASRGAPTFLAAAYPEPKLCLGAVGGGMEVEVACLLASPCTGALQTDVEGWPLLMLLPREN